MIGPKETRPTKAEERKAYADCTERDGGKCVRCGWYGNVQRDHRKNRSQQGWTTVANLQLLCAPCHLWKGANVTAAVLEGFAVPGFARPELWPAWRILVGWVTYFDEPDADGNWWAEITTATADMLMGQVT